MGMLDLVMPKFAPAEPVEIPEFVPSDTSALDDRQLMEAIFQKLERAEHIAKGFAAQAAASPVLASFVPKLD